MNETKSMEHLSLPYHLCFPKPHHERQAKLVYRYELESNRVERGEQNLSFGNEQKEYSDPQSIRAPIVATVLGFQIAPVNN